MTAPVATYRLQLRGAVDLVAARRWLPYLERLGVSHLYLSPVLRAVPGSTHGYDVVDPTEVDPALGGEAALDALAADARRRGMGLVVDIVPNHMAADPDRNPWWRQLLRDGRASTVAGHFDVDWEPPDRKLRNRVLVPVLGDHYGRVLDRRELRVERDGSDVRVRYHERTFPLDPRSLAGVVHRAAAAAGSPSLELVARTLASLPAGTDPSPPLGAFAERAADLDAALPALAAALADPAAARALDEAVADLDADGAALHEVLDAQSYRLARWTTGADELGYRRFFDVTELVAVRVERPEVFDATHDRIRRWVDDGVVDGLRVDHPDGLADPAGYAERLRALAPTSWIVVEKILEGDEELPPWPVDGTTGYEVAAAVNRLLVDPTGHAELVRGTAERLGTDLEPTAAIIDAKAEVVATELAAELRRLTTALVEVCEDHPRWRDFSRRELREALIAALAALPVYRTYVDHEGRASSTDRAVLDLTVTRVAVRRPDIDPDLLALVRGAVLGDPPFTGGPAATFRRRFQQLSGAVMAKGKEDTALYRLPALLAVDEVGADPARPAAPAAALHRLAGRIAADRPGTMVALSTHDTKRSEDVRARLDVLSEDPGAYLGALDRFAALHTDWGGLDPDPLAVATCFQTLVGAHPLPADRLLGYATKAMREARRRTSWLEVDEAYEAALATRVAAMTEEPSASIVAELAADVLVDGRVNALAQRLLLLMLPGVPDQYQGTELWDLSLVDPDNRRPVDLDQRVARLEAGGWDDPATPLPGWSSLVDPDDPGTAKLALTVRALRVRRAHPDAFGASGGHTPLAAAGPAADHVVAFGRGDDVVVAVPRLSRVRRRVHGGWAGTELLLPTGCWRDALTPGRRWDHPVPVDELFGPVPVALLERVP